MRSRDRTFVGACLALTLVVPGLLLAAAPFGEARAQLGTIVGWSLALLVMVPSYMLLTRTASQDDPNKFIRGFMLGTLMRLVVTGLVAVLFVLLVEHPPVKNFLLAFFLGYMMLTTLELTLTLRKSEERTSA